MKKKDQLLTLQEDLLVDLTLHNISTLLLEEFAQKIAQPYYNGNVNAAIQDLLHKSLAEQDFVHRHITHIRNPKEN